MPVRRGHVAPRTTIIETIIRKFDTHNRSFLVANAHHGLCHIIYCSDGFCRMSGFSRAEVMQRPAVCDFLHGPLTSQHAIAVVRDALAIGAEKHFEILYYRKDGTKFLCSEVIAPIKSEVDDICLYIINFEDLTAPPTPAEDAVATPAGKLSKFDRARLSFRQSLRMGSLRGRGLRLAGYLTPPSDVTTEEAEEDEAKERRVSPFAKPTSTPAPPPPAPPPPPPQPAPQPQPQPQPPPPSQPAPAPAQTPPAPIASPEAMSNAWDLDEMSMARTVPHASSLDAISRSPRVSETPAQQHKIPARSATVSAFSAVRSLERNIYDTHLHPHTVDNFCEATHNHVSKAFPITSSESDLQWYRATATLWDRSSRDRKSPSLSNVPSDSLKHKFSIQDNGSAKFFQGALHTPNMGEKVAQV